MTHPTLPPFAKDTPRTDDKPDTSGIQAENIDPLYVDTLDYMLAARSMKSAEMSDIRYFLWYWRGRLKHAFGFHTFVPLEEWDMEVASVQYIGLVCWHCTEIRK